MFTGIVEDIGTVKHIEKRGAFGRITIETALPLAGVKAGDSISVDGACLTAVAFSGGSFSADVSDETLRVTTLGGLAPGAKVNLELALTLSKPLGGHLVTGHVDGVGVIRRMEARGENTEVEVSLPRDLMHQVVMKGSIAIDGISLTVAALGPDSVTIAVIPHTLRSTGFLSKRQGAKVNVETDLIGKYVGRLLAGKDKGGVTEELLSEHGFMKKG